MAKNNIRSFRYSDEVSRVLEAFAGDSLNEKFENLVLFCHAQIPQLRKKKAHIESSIAELEEREEALYRDISRLSGEILEMKNCKSDLIQIHLKCLDIRERMETVCNTLPGSAAR